MSTIRLGRHRLSLPANRTGRRVLGGGLVIAGVLGFLPVVGYWMVPAGLIVLSVDSARIRRLRRKSTVGLGYWLKRRWPGLAGKIGFSPIGRRHAAS